jgi:hypothetical protein
MKRLFVLMLFLFGHGAFSQVVSPDGIETGVDSLETKVANKGVSTSELESDTAEAPLNILLGLGVLPRHELVKSGFVKPPFRLSVGAVDLYKGFGVIGTYEWRKADVPYFENDPSVLTDRYSRFIFGPTYKVGPLTIYAQMDLFGKYGFFRSVGNNNNIIGSGRKALGASFDLYKGVSIGLDFSNYAGVGVNVVYILPIKI